GRAGPDAVVQVAAQVPELGPDLRLRPAGHLPADTLTALVTEGHSGHPIVVRLVVVDRVFAMAASRPGFSHVSMILVWLLPESWLFGPIRSQLLYLRKSGGRNWVRTRDPSLVRRNTVGIAPSFPGWLKHLNCENHVRRCPRVPGRVCTVVPASGSRSITGNHGQVGIGRSARHRDLVTPRLRSELGPGGEASRHDHRGSSQCRQMGPLQAVMAGNSRERN